MRHLLIIPFVALATAPVSAQTMGVFDTGEDMFAEDGPWIAVPADFNDGVMTAADIVLMADLDGDPSNLTEEERAMIAVLTQVLIQPAR